MNCIKLLVLSAAAAIPAASIVLASASGPNLVANGDFSAGVAGWDNFSGNPTAQAGAMKITNNYAGNGNSYYSGWYCLKVNEGTEYQANIDYFVPQAAPENSGASLDTHFYASNDCSGGNLLTGGGGNSGGRLPDQRGQWLSFSFKTTAPATAHSMRLRATAFKEPKPYASSIPEVHAVLFDNAYFGEASKPIVNPDPKPPVDEPKDVVDAPTDDPKTPAGPGNVAADADPKPPVNDPAPSGQDTPADDSAVDTPSSDPSADTQGLDSNDTTIDDVNAGKPADPVVTPAAPSTGVTQETGADSKLMLGLALIAGGLGAAAIAFGAAFKLRRREDEE